MGKPLVVTRLSLMMFIQFFIWGAWFATVNQCLDGKGLADIIGSAYGSAPIAAIFAPLFLGLVADRFFSSERVMAVLFLIGGVLMCLVPGYVNAGKGSVVVWLFIGHMLCYMPTLGLSNSVAFSNVPDQSWFPRIRVWGTIGWIAAGLLIGFMGWTANPNMFWIAGISSLVMGVYSFTLPHTPPPGKEMAVSMRSLLMVDALQLLTRRNFLVFMLGSCLICIPFAYYFFGTGVFLGDNGFQQPVSVMTIGQMSEIFFMLLIPFFFRRLGVKVMLLIGMLAWTARYGLYVLGAPDQVAWMLFMAIAIHGICYDFFFVTGFMYTDKVASSKIRSQAQSMLVFFTQGIGMYLGFWIADVRFGKTVTSHGALAAAIKEGRPETEFSFVDSLVNMFSVEKLTVDKQLVAETMAQWQSFWWVPAIIAAIIAVLFFLLFWDKMENHDEKEVVSEADAAAAAMESEQP